MHDAFVISAPTDRLEDDVAAMREIMSKAGRAVTGGLNVRTSVKVACWPDRYMDSRGEGMWGKVIELLERLDAPGAHQRDTTVSPAKRDGVADDTADQTVSQITHLRLDRLTGDMPSYHQRAPV